MNTDPTPPPNGMEIFYPEPDDPVPPGTMWANPGKDDWDDYEFPDFHLNTLLDSFVFARPAADSRPIK